MMTNLQAYGNGCLKGALAVWNKERVWFQPFDEWLYEEYPHTGTSPKEIIRQALNEDEQQKEKHT